MVSRGPAKMAYAGWIPNADFYAVTLEQFEKLLAEKKVPLNK